MMPCQEDLSATEFQMHSLEMEAYSAVLRAFHAQSDCLTWEREALISELRKELRVSDVEHREFLSKVNSDDTVKIIREWHDDVARKQKTLYNTMNVPLKKLKTTHITGSPSPRFLPCAKPSTAAKPSLLTNECGNDTAAYSNQGNEGQGLKIDAHSRHQPSMVKHTAPVVVRMKKGFSNLGVENINRGSDTFEILATDRLIDEVEMILRQNPNPCQMHKVKLVLREQERALCKALEKLIDVSIEDDSPDQLHQRYSHQDMQRFGQGSDDDDLQRFGRGSCNPFFGQVDGVRGFVAQSASMGRRDLADRSGIPCIEIFRTSMNGDC